MVWTCPSVAQLLHTSPPCNNSARPPFLSIHVPNIAILYLLKNMVNRTANACTALRLDAMPLAAFLEIAAITILNTRCTMHQRPYWLILRMNLHYLQCAMRPCLSCKLRGFSICSSCEAGSSPINTAREDGRSVCCLDEQDSYVVCS